MNSSHVDTQTDTQVFDEAAAIAEAAAITGAAAVADAAAVAVDELADQPRIRRVVAAARKPVHSIMGAARAGVSAVRRGSSQVAAHLPGTIRLTRSAATRTVEALQTLPDTTLQAVAATSVGLGAGLSFTRAGRLAMVAGLVPAVVVATVIAARPLAPAGVDVTGA
jgi:hypothetical protein